MGAAKVEDDLSRILINVTHLMSVRIEEDGPLPHAGSEDEAAAPALIVTPAKAGVHAVTGTGGDRWIPAFAGMTGGAGACHLCHDQRIAA